MNKIILNELNKCQDLNIPSYDDSTTQLIIEKSNKQPSDISLQIGGKYIIQLANYIVNPPENFTLQDNWNKGIIPKSNVLKCELTNIMGKMIKIRGNGFDITNRINKDDYYDELWLPQKGFTIIEKV